MRKARFTEHRPAIDKCQLLDLLRKFGSTIVFQYL